MKMKDVYQLLTINKEPEECGYIVHFFWQHGKILGKDRPSGCIVEEYFPDFLDGEEPLTLSRARAYAEQLKRILGDQIEQCEAMALFSSVADGFYYEPLEQTIQKMECIYCDEEIRPGMSHCPNCKASCETVRYVEIAEDEC